MDPYLEQTGIWNQVHTSLIVAIQRFLARRLRPKYIVTIEQRTFVAVADQPMPVGKPDVLVVMPQSSLSVSPSPVPVLAEVREAYTVEVPLPEEVRQRYLEVRDQVTGEAVTVIELLSPTNKTNYRRRYLAKRLDILGGETNLVEIDLLRGGKPMPMTGDAPATHYRILVSRAWTRPRAQAFLFNIQQPIPDTPIPLRRGEAEPRLPLNQLLHEIYDAAGYDLMVDYRRPPAGPLDEATAAWAAEVLADFQASKQK